MATAVPELCDVHLFGTMQSTDPLAIEEEPWLPPGRQGGSRASAGGSGGGSADWCAVFAAPPSQQVSLAGRLWSGACDGPEQTPVAGTLGVHPAAPGVAPARCGLPAPAAGSAAAAAAALAAASGALPSLLSSRAAFDSAFGAAAGLSLAPVSRISSGSLALLSWASLRRSWDGQPLGDGDTASGGAAVGSSGTGAGSGAGSTCGAEGGGACGMPFLLTDDGGDLTSLLGELMEAPPGSSAAVGRSCILSSAPSWLPPAAALPPQPMLQNAPHAAAKSVGSGGGARPGAQDHRDAGAAGDAGTLAGNTAMLALAASLPSRLARLPLGLLAPALLSEAGLLAVPHAAAPAAPASVTGAAAQPAQRSPCSWVSGGELCHDAARGRGGARAPANACGTAPPHGEQAAWPQHSGAVTAATAQAPCTTARRGQRPARLCMQGSRGGHGDHGPSRTAQGRRRTPRRRSSSDGSNAGEHACKRHCAAATASPSPRPESSPTAASPSACAVSGAGDAVAVQRRGLAVGHSSTSSFKGVTRHRWTNKWEAHLWDAHAARKSGGAGGRTRGKQVYLGAFGSEEGAARAYDKAALTYWGHAAKLNFSEEDYADELPVLLASAREDVVAALRRGTSCFARGICRYRGVRPHGTQAGVWEAWLPCVGGGDGEQLLGVFADEAAAARAYDAAIVVLLGSKAATNFPQ